MSRGVEPRCRCNPEVLLERINSHLESGPRRHLVDLRAQVIGSPSQFLFEGFLEVFGA